MLSKACTKCWTEKFVSEFYVVARRGKPVLSPSCIPCVKARNKSGAWKMSAAARALYRRKSGAVSVTVPYIPLAVIHEVAALKRIGDHQRTIARNASRAARGWAANDAGVMHLRRNKVGSDEWLASADSSQIATLRLAESVLKSAASRSGETRLIKLSGKWAVGEYEFAIVDAEDYDFLARWAWKAKWNGSGSGVYAVRNTILNGRQVTIRMHREVLGIGQHDGLDVDHDDWNTLNNSLSNLRPATRSQNVRRRKPSGVDLGAMAEAA